MCGVSTCAKNLPRRAIVAAATNEALATSYFSEGYVEEGWMRGNESCETRVGGHVKDVRR